MAAPPSRRSMLGRELYAELRTQVADGKRPGFSELHINLLESGATVAEFDGVLVEGYEVVGVRHRKGSSVCIASGEIALRSRPGRPLAAQDQRSPRLNVTASKGRMQIGPSSLALAINAHWPSRSSNASRARSAGSTSHRRGTPSRA